ncbi:MULTISPECIES: N-acyl amino acid synthase FeeM domain-containing protein [Sphingobium]|uniref:N-acyl amino acid synthase FeeM domain-containing protein n=1 Tax=Sphingobium TaxID=165695 RepID=UPI0015EBCE69|nr:MULTISPECIES: acetyltransferase [Sphingobium]MCW2362057.1 hypothetical protein [Sphingobium sp. B10D3B]MCW2401264.1 hypothetical protein [Sphingobium sp. B10D7B]MCW2408244.1 hypothetical protein [Sphingobium xanthum]
MSASLAEPHGGLLSVRRIPSACGQRLRTIDVRLADRPDLRQQAHDLLNRMYGWRGYGMAHLLPDNGDHQAVFTAALEDAVIATLTLTVDSPAGLSTDQTFRTELDALREAPGARLCELTKFAVDPMTKSPSVLAGLFHVIFIYGMQRFDCTDLVIEVHPRHVRYYEAMLGFDRLGPPKMDESVSWWPKDTPVQLMRLKVCDVADQINRFAGRADKIGRSLYPYFFSRDEEQDVARRVARLWDRDAGCAEPRSRNGMSGTFWRSAA